MQEDLKLVVKRKFHQQKQDSGIVQIVFTIDSADAVDTPDSNQFPSRTVWISSGYDDIEERFGDDELFLLDSFRPIEVTSSDPEVLPSEGRAEYWAGGKTAKKLHPGTFVPVIMTELPDVGSGMLNFHGELPNDQFFILSSDKNVYGPFLAIQTENETVAQPNQCLPLGLQQQHVAKVSKEDLIEKGIYLPAANDLWLSASGFITAIKDISSLLRDKIEQVDYISDSQLVTYFARNGFGAASSKLGRKQAEQLKSAITEESKKKQKLSDNERLSRLETVLDQYLEHSDFGWPIINSWLGSDAGKAFLADLILKHPQIASSHTEELNYEKNRIAEEITQLQADKRRAEQEIYLVKSQVIEERKNAQLEIEQIKQQTIQQQQEERQRVMADLEQKISEKQNELENVQESLRALQNTLKTALNLEALKEDVKHNERKLDDLKFGVREQENLLRSPAFVNELIKTDTILGLLQGRDFSAKQILKPYIVS